MMYATTMTQKGQVTIPADIRKRLNLKPYEKVAFSYSDNTVTIQPARDFISLKGSIKTQKPVTDNQANTAILEHIKKEHEKDQ